MTLFTFSDFMHATLKQNNVGKRKMASRSNREIEEADRLQRLRNEIEHFAQVRWSRDKDEDPDGLGTVGDPHFQQFALKELSKLLEEPTPAHRPFNAHRIQTNWAEKIFSDLWAIKNEIGSPNGGIASALLKNAGVQESLIITRSIATIITWLGTNVGIDLVRQMHQFDELGCKFQLDYSNPEYPLRTFPLQTPQEAKMLKIIQATKCWCDVNAIGLSIESLLTSRDSHHRDVGRVASILQTTEDWPGETYLRDLPHDKAESNDLDF